MTVRTKPLGLTLIALYSALIALMAVPVGCTVTLAGQVPGVGGFASIFGFLITLLGLISCAVVYGLWTLQEWGRSLAFWLYLASVPLGVIAIFPPMAGPKATVGNTTFQLVGIAIDLLVVTYLAKPQVKHLFSALDNSVFAPSSNRQEPY